MIVSLVMVMVMVYGVYGLSDVPFEEKTTIIFFVVFISLFMSKLEFPRDDRSEGEFENR